jgi:hypothetical protein
VTAFSYREAQARHPIGLKAQLTEKVIGPERNKKFDKLKLIKSLISSSSSIENIIDCFE